MICFFFFRRFLFCKRFCCFLDIILVKLLLFKFDWGFLIIVILGWLLIIIIFTGMEKGLK